MKSLLLFVLFLKLKVAKCDICPSEWELFQDYCYHVADPRGSWQEGQEYCKWMDPESNILCLNTEAEMKFIKGKMFWNMWIGLYQKDGNWQWSDKTPKDFSFWGNMPLIDNKQCGHISSSGKWKRKKCKNKFHFACRVNANPCPMAWERIEDACYYVSKETASWYRAEKKCMRMHENATLASIHNWIVQEYLREKMFWTVWLGLEMPDGADHWRWIDGSELDMEQWGVTGEPDHTNETCITLSDALTWESESCQSYQRFICKKPSSPCPPSWILENNECWFFSRKEAAWQNAEQQCSQLDDRAHLAMIRSVDDDTVASRYLHHRLWVGQTHVGHRWKNDVSYHCAALDYGGDLLSVPCYYQYNFACQKASMSCPTQWWTSVSSACIYISDYKASWDGAKEVCQQQGGELVSITYPHQLRFILDQIVPLLWIGLSHRYGQWQWADSSPVSFWVNWQDGISASSKKCMTYDSTQSNNNSQWTPLDCSSTLPFLCNFPLESKGQETHINPPSNSVSCLPVHSDPGAFVACSDRFGRSISCHQTHFVGSTARFHCDQFWEPAVDFSDSVIMCTHRGQWVGNSPLQCRPICGVGSMDETRATFIHNGQKVLFRGQWPWHVGIYVRDYITWVFSCGGTLITQQIVLTAGHCVGLNVSRILPPADLLVALGKHFLEFEKDDQYVETVRVKRIIPHHHYDYESLEADIALLVLEKPVKFSSNVRPVCLPSPGIIPRAGIIATVVGWGWNELELHPSELHQGKLLVKNWTTCLNYYNGSLPDGVFCAGFMNNTNVCTGDSGGGLVTRIDGSSKWQVEGVVSFGLAHTHNRTCIPKAYSVYVQVSSYIDWIKGMIASTHTPAVWPSTGAKILTKNMGNNTNEDETCTVELAVAEKPCNLKRAQIIGCQKTFSDNSACPQNWYGNPPTCYWFSFGMRKTWRQAKYVCNEMAASILTISTSDQQLHVLSILGKVLSSWQSPVGVGHQLRKSLLWKWANARSVMFDDQIRTMAGHRCRIFRFKEICTKKCKRQRAKIGCKRRVAIRFRKKWLQLS